MCLIWINLLKRQNLASFYYNNSETEYASQGFRNNLFIKLFWNGDDTVTQQILDMNDMKILDVTIYTGIQK